MKRDLYRYKRSHLCLHEVGGTSKTSLGEVATLISFLERGIRGFQTEFNRDKVRLICPHHFL